MESVILTIMTASADFTTDLKRLTDAEGKAQLTGRLQEHLPFAQANRTVLPESGGLQLYLLNHDFAQHQLSDEQQRAIMNYPAYWAFCWASGQVMAAQLNRHPHWVAGKRVLDFGSGSGVAGIAAARAGASEVIACDIDEDALMATGINAKLNECEISLVKNFHACEGDVDLILAADVLYDKENLHWLDIFVERADMALVADSRVKDFAHPAYDRLGTWSSTTLPDLDESSEFRSVNIYRGSKL